MTRSLFSGLAISLLAVEAAMAHPGHHDGLSAAGLIDHIASSPFHLMWLILPVAAIAGLVFWRRRATATATVRKPRR